MDRTKHLRKTGKSRAVFWKVFAKQIFNIFHSFLVIVSRLLSLVVRQQLSIEKNYEVFTD